MSWKAESPQAVALKYLELLGAGATEALIALFAPDARVHSPLYGSQPAPDFYHMLAEATQNSELELQGLFETREQDRLALYFTYHWTLEDGQKTSFEVVDILHFNAQYEITDLKIIYDTVQTRPMTSPKNP